MPRAMTSAFNRSFGGVVAMREPDQEIGVLVSGESAQYVLEIPRTHLGRSAGAGRVARQPDLLARLRVRHPGIHVIPLPFR